MDVGLATFALSQPVFLLVAWIIGTVARTMLRGRAIVTGATMTVVSVLGVSLGFLIASLIYPEASPWRPMVLVLAFVVDVVVLTVASAVIVSRRAAEQVPEIPEVIALGESDRVEFKSSARWNLHTEQRDDRMEQVVAKTVAAFLNSTGGSLVLGVDDAGVMLGLAPDFTTLKSPDVDRFELWLRDLLQTRLDPTAAGLPAVDFLGVTDEDVASDRAAEGSAGSVVCRVRCPASLQPVYVKGKSGPELWVRVGNSTRSLGIDDAVSYIRHRWPQSIGSMTRDRLTGRGRGLTVAAAVTEEDRAE